MRAHDPPAITSPEILLKENDSAKVSAKPYIKANSGELSLNIKSTVADVVQW